MKNIANNAARTTTASPAPTPIPAAAPVDSPDPDDGSGGDDPVEDGAESPVSVAVPEVVVVVGATAFAVRLVVGYVCVIISQKIHHSDLISQKNLTFTVEYRLSPMVLKLVNVKCSPDCAEVIFESIAIKPVPRTFSRQSVPLARLEK